MESAQHATYQAPLPSTTPASEALSQDLLSEHDLGYGAPVRAQSDSSRSYAARAAARPDLFLDTAAPDQSQLPQSPESQEDLYNPTTASTDQVTRRSTVSGRSPLQNLERSMSKEEKRVKVEQAENVARQRSTSSRNPAAWPSAQRTAPTDPVLQKPLPPAPISPTSPQDPSRQRVRSYGYDSSLTGGAAAAAVGAYQASKRRQYDPSESVPLAQYNSYAPQTGSRSVSGPASTTAPPFVLGATSSQIPRKPVQSNGLTSQSNPNGLGVERDEPLPPEKVAYSGDSLGPNYVIPPQTSAGQQARKQVAFQQEDPNDYGTHSSEINQGHHLRDFFRRDHSKARRYQGSTFLDEWQAAETAVLTSQELDFEVMSADSRAWWERGGPVKAPEQGDLDQPQNSFTPALNLKCGPLLRYTGIGRDPETEKEFWRGSIMIVTEDATSSYSTPPTLKVFKQPLTLVESPTPAPNTNGETLTAINSDPIVGSPKISRTGETLYVKPVQNLHSEVDLSQTETEEGLFSRIYPENVQNSFESRLSSQDGEKAGLFQEAKAFRLHSERGLTFWRFNIRIELTSTQNRVAYRINGGPATGFWVPAKGQAMNVAFHSCNGFSLSINSNDFCGPDPLWRDLLNTHQFRPFHCLIGGGDQIYNDAAMKQTKYFQAWLALHNPEEKHSADFTVEMQEELEQFYLYHYAAWFSQGLFGLANSQIPMVNVWDDHDIIDGFGSYPHHFMATPVFSGVGAVAFKYYMLFQHQSVVEENEQTEPSWLLGASPGPYINQLSRSLFLSLGKGMAFVGLDCRTERRRDEVLCQETYDLVFDRCRRELESGETRHLIVLLGVPIAYPRLNFLENVLTSRALDPIKALGRAGVFSGFVNRFDGGVEILDDLDDHWTAKHHKSERNWFIQELQELAAEKSVRITILGGDVHLAAVGQFFSNPKLGVPKDHDHRYMPNIISSAIVNTPPPEMMADVLNKRNKIHHLDRDTDEDMIPMFFQDVNGKSRNNRHLLPRRNWCSIREYEPGSTPPTTPPPEVEERPRSRRRSFSFSRSRSRSRQNGESRGFLHRFSSKAQAPPSSYRGPTSYEDSNPYITSNLDPRVDGSVASSRQSEDSGIIEDRGRSTQPRSNSFHRVPTGLSRRASQSDRSGRQGHIDLQGGLDIVINCEIDQKDPAGFTVPYRLIVPALSYQGDADPNTAELKSGGIAGFLGSFRRGRSNKQVEPTEAIPYDSTEDRSVPAADEQASRGGNIEPSGLAAGLGLGAGTLAVAGAFAHKDEPLLQRDPENQDANTQVQPTVQTGQSQSRHNSGQLFGEIPNTESSQARGSSAPTLPTTTRPPSQHSPRVFGGPSRPASSGQSYGKTSSQDSPVSNKRSSSAREVRPRSEVPVKRFSALGPPPPSNIDQLPASVRKRYEQLNDPEQNERLRQVETSSSRYTQMNSPQSIQPYNQYDFILPSQAMNSRPVSQHRSTSAQARQSTSKPAQIQQPRIIPGPAPPPQPQDTHRRYSGAPMEMPLLPTNINQLRSSTHRTVQDSSAYWGESTTQRSTSDPIPSKSASASAAYHKAQLTGTGPIQSPSTNQANSQSLNGGSRDIVNSEPSSSASRPVSTAVMPPMVPLSRGQARKSTEIPSYPSPLTSHSTRDTYLVYNEPQNQALGVGNSRVPVGVNLPANPTRPLDREFSDAAYGYRSSYDGARYSTGPDKVARHFGGFDGAPTGDNGRVSQEHRYDDGYDDGGKRSRGLGGVMRKFSERRKRREFDKEERERARHSAYSDVWFDAPENYDDFDSEEDDYESDTKRRSWKFWQR